VSSKALHPTLSGESTVGDVMQEGKQTYSNRSVLSVEVFEGKWKMGQKLLRVFSGCFS
jgi:hypothetical protein